MINSSLQFLNGKPFFFSFLLFLNVRFSFQRLEKRIYWTWNHKDMMVFWMFSKSQLFSKEWERHILTSSWILIIRGYVPKHQGDMHSKQCALSDVFC